MAVLHKKEEKIQAVLGRLPKKYTTEEFVELFIKLYSKDWGKIKSAYIKQSQDKEPGTIINMPKPNLYLEQILASFLAKQAAVKSALPEIAEEIIPVAPEVLPKKTKVASEKKITSVETEVLSKKDKAVSKEKKIIAIEAEVLPKKTKAVPKEKKITPVESEVLPKKTKAAPKEKKK